MLRSIRKLAVALLLLVLPLQGLAASLSHLMCAAPAAADLAHGAHHHDGADAHHGHDAGGPAGTDGAPGHSGEFACHQILSAIPSLAVAALPDLEPGFAAADPLPLVPYFPEQPRPVPLA